MKRFFFGLVLILLLGSSLVGCIHNQRAATCVSCSSCMYGEELEQKEKQAFAGNVDAAAAVALHNLTCEADTRKQRRWIEMAAYLGDTNSQNNMAYFLVEEQGEAGCPMALTWLQRSAAAGDRFAIERLKTIPCPKGEL